MYFTASSIDVREVLILLCNEIRKAVNAAQIRLHGIEAEYLILRRVNMEQPPLRSPFGERLSL